MAEGGRLPPGYGPPPDFGSTRVAFDTKGFDRLCESFQGIGLLGESGTRPYAGLTAVPLDGAVARVEAAIRKGQAVLPLRYQDAYVAPLLRNLGHVIAGGDDDGVVALNVETLAGAVAQHAADNEARPEVRQFLAVVSHFYRSFLGRARRAAVNVPPAFAQLPPLVTFQSTGALGPFTLPTDQVQMLCGADVGVVSLPDSYRKHPVVWATLAHETGGHDVLHADPSLLPELSAGVRTLFGGGPLAAGATPNRDQVHALLWSYWVDEAAADVYGLLNLGPAFAFNLAAFLTAFRAATGSSLQTAAGSQPGGDLDVHPVDVLRLHVAAGVIESLIDLDPQHVEAHLADLQALIDHCGGGSGKMSVDGYVEIDRHRWVLLRQSMPMAEAAAAARRVGAYLATTRLSALGNHRVQDVETWTNADELAADQIRKAFGGRRPRVVDMGNDSQLLAGATLALLENPHSYRRVNEALAVALDHSFQRDPIMGFARPHLLAPNRAPGTPGTSPVPDDPAEAAPKTGVGEPPGPAGPPHRGRPPPARRRRPRRR